MSIDRVLPWLLRATWAVLPLVAGPAFAGALEERSRPVQLTASIGLWAAWAVTLVATLVLHPITLTIVRAVTPAAFAASVAAATSGASSGASVIAVIAALVAVIVAMLPETSVAFVNGPAYPNERRFPLRPPGPLLLAPLPIAWALAVALPAAGVLLLAAKRWVFGGVALVAGAVAAFVLGRAMYTLAKRWFVFVPAGVVLHDPMSLADPVLFRRMNVRSIDAAPADTDATDVTARAFGLAIELVVNEPATVALIKAGSRTPTNVKTTKLLFTPSRPGAVLAEARARRLD